MPAGGGVIGVGEAALVPVPALAVVLVVVVELDVEAGGGALLGAVVGTVKTGAPAVLVDPEPPLPQPATRAIIATTATTTATTFCDCDLISPSSGAFRSRAATCACRNTDSRSGPSGVC